MSNQLETDFPCLPPWLSEQPGIERLLNVVINRLNNKPGSTPGFTLNEKTLPDLYAQAETADLTWSLLQTLFEKETLIFRFTEAKKRTPFDPVFSNARINFNPKSEALLRKWLNRPHVESELQQWKKRVEQNAQLFPGDVRRLIARKITVTGKEIEDVINGFVEINKYINDELTLRSLSAKCFWQDSKFLDNKEELIRLLYPQIKIKLRALLVNVYLPENITGVLFIENQDSYNQAIDGFPKTAKNLALVYSAGFKLSAQRIRESEGVSLHFHCESDNNFKKQFIAWWYETISSDSAIHWPVYFWGDLDYAGMGILVALKQRFKSIQAWQEGYRPMLDMLIAGAGHAPEATGKQEQKDTGETGCEYADKQLLPVLHKTGKFVDQEMVCK